MTTLTGSRPFYWFLALVAATAATVVLADSWVRLDTVRLISSISFSEDPAGKMTVPPGTRKEHLVLPSSSMDAKWWVLHAQDLLEKGQWRIRSTALDNAPDGREVHWSNLLIWLIASLAWVMSLFNNMPPVENCATAALFIGPILLAMSCLLLGALAWLRFGWCGAVALLAIYLTNPSIYRTFHLGEADHHGIVLVFAMACVFCLVAGGGGFVSAAKGRSAGTKDFPRPVMAKRWFWASGAFGAAALWVSAATMLPVLAALGVAAIVSGALGKVAGAAPMPALWRDWALAGACASFGFYLLEYFPGLFGWRLEVNHPVYAVGWLGAGLCLQWILQWMTSGRMPSRKVGLWWGLALAAIPAIVLLGWENRVFYVSDPFLLALHKEYILEFQSFFTLLREPDNPGTWFFHYGWPAFAIILAGCAILRGWLAPAARVALPLLFFPAMMMQALALWQVRWAYAAMGMWTLCAFFLVVAVVGATGAKPVISRLVAWCATLTAVFALLLSFIPQLIASIHHHATCLQAPIKEEVGSGLLLRDIAHRLLQSSPHHIPVVLSGPNSSTLLAYFGRIRGLGTLYWENMEGLKKAARIFAAADEAEALTLIQEAGVTHLVIPSWENFGAPYARLYAIESGVPAHPDGAPFFKSIIEGNECPQWLRPFCYPIPTATGIDGTSVRIFAVLPEQSEFEWLLFRGVYHFEAGEVPEAVTLFERARALRPSDPRPGKFLAAATEQIQGHGEEKAQD